MTGNEFKYALKSLGIRKARFARFVDVDYTTVFRWGNGDLKVPVAIERLLDLLKLNHEIMLDLSEGGYADPLHVEPQFKLDAYQILGIDPSSSAKDFRSAYLRLMKIHHPDVGGSAEMAASISGAYEAAMRSASSASQSAHR